MLKMRRNRTTDAVETDADVAPADASTSNDATSGTDQGRGRISPFGIGMQVTALVVVGIVMIAGLALLGDARLATTVATGQTDRRALDTDHTNVTLALAAAERAESASSGYLDSFARAGANIVVGRSASAAADASERALTDLAQSLQPLDATSRAFAVAAAKSFYLRPWDETVENAQEATFIRVNKERVALIVKTAQDMPALLAGMVLDNQETTAAVRSGIMSDARDIILERQSPKVAAIDKALYTLRTAMVDFSFDVATRHAALARAIETGTQERYEEQRQSTRLQILLLVLVLCAGGVLIAFYGLAIPLADLTAAAGRFASGRFEMPTTVLGRRDELGRLSSALEKLRETMFAEKQASAQTDHEQKEADRLARMTLEREVQQLRRDRDRLEKERLEREQADANAALTVAQVSPEALEQERAAIRTELTAELAAETERKIAELTAQHSAAVQQANDEVTRLTAELAKLQSAPAPADDADLRANLEKATADVARLKDELEKSRAAATDPANDKLLAQARAEISRLSNEQVRERDVARKALAEAAAAVEAERNAARERERKLASALALEKQQHEDDQAAARATQTRAVAEVETRLSEQYGDRLRVLTELANSFETSIAAAMSAVQHASDGVKLASQRIGEVAQRSNQHSGETAERVGRASTSIHDAVKAAEQIAAAIDEIAQQASQSSHVASGAASAARTAIGAVQNLETAASRMSEAGAFLADIADRTNVLSLNATIEAARAGDSGKGFVVVAAEIKSLANRAGRSGKELAERVKAVSAATGSVRTAFSGVDAAISQIETLSSATTRAITQQGATARTIVQDVHAAAEGTDSVGRAVSETNASVASAGQVVAQAQTAADILNAQAQELRAQIDEFLAAIRAA